MHGSKEVWRVDEKKKRAVWHCYRFASNADGTINRNVEYASCSLCDKESQMPNLRTQLAVCPNCGVKMIPENRIVCSEPVTQLNYLMYNSERCIVCNNEDELALVLTYAEAMGKAIPYPVLFKEGMKYCSAFTHAHLCKSEEESL